MKKVILLLFVVVSAAFSIISTYLLLKDDLGGNVINLTTGFLTLFFLLIFFCLTFLSLYDLLYFEIPLNFTLFTLGVVILLILGSLLGLINTALFPNPWVNVAVGLIIAAIIFITVKASNEKIMGEGDIYLGAIAGLLLGFPKIIVGFYVTILTASFFGIVVAIIKRKFKGELVPFIPFICIGIIVALLFYDALIGVFTSGFFLGVK